MSRFPKRETPRHRSLTEGVVKPTALNAVKVGLRDRGIVFYLFSRIFLAVAGITLVAPLMYMPIYKNRIGELMEGQADTFIGNLIAVQGEALYREDFASVIDYTQKVLGNAQEITGLTLLKHDRPPLEITPDGWRLLDTNEALAGNAALSDPRLSIERPINLSNLDWGNVRLNISGEQRAELMREYYTNFVAFSVLLLASVLLLMYLSSRPIVRQLDTLRRSALHIADGELSSRVTGTAIGELGPVSSSFNRMAEALEEQSRRIGQLAKVVEEAQEGVAIFDASGTEVFANPALEALFSQSTNKRPHTQQELLECFEQNTNTGRDSNHQNDSAPATDYRLRGSSPEVHVELSLQILDPLNTGDRHEVLTITDITWRKGLEARLQELAHYDKLTTLPNRRQFLSALEAAFEEEQAIAVLFMDLDNFKTINDSLGHDAGDQVLAETAKRLRHHLRPEDLVARLGGDEFTAILYGVDNAESVRLTCQKVLAVLQEPTNHAGQELRVGVSIGAVLANEACTSSQEALRFADIAMYHTKKRGKSGFSIFEPKMLIEAMSRAETEDALRLALANRALDVHYQPIVSATGELCALEALVRWPGSGLMPDQFIPLAEETTLIVDLDRYVLEHTLRRAHQWRLAERQIRVSVNLSGRTVQTPHIVTTISEVLQQHHHPPELLQLEVTENVLINPEHRLHVQQTLNHLRALGCRVALDDFGRGYSSLGYLLDFDIDVIKFDRAFVARFLDNPKAAAIVSIILNMADALGVETVAEGVETQAQAQWLTDRHCSYLQGYLYARPLPEEEFAEHWLSGPKSLPETAL